MSPETEARLLEINRRFYESFGEAFSRARQSPWPGWDRVLAHLFERTGARPSEPISVLDAGCGNGRFAARLDAALAERKLRASYLGIDASRAMIAEAGARRLSLVNLDLELEAGDIFDAGTGRRFTLIALMGVLHHLPGAARRRRLIAHLMGLLEPGGILAATLWRFGGRARFVDRIVPFDEADPSVDTADLDEGDFLIRFGEARAGGLRYCHLISDGEAEAIFEGAGSLVDRFDSDGASGDLNRYLILEANRTLSAPR